MKILLMDDEEYVLDLLKETVMTVLPQEEYACFGSSLEAVKYAERNPVDIAFLDINMRIMDGVTVAKKIQSLHPQVNIIFCTGYKEYALDAMKLYCSGYLLKPITEQGVREAIQNLRHPIPAKECRVTIQCYGNFEIYVDAEPVVFKYNRTKELLAYLVDRNGVDCSTKELIAFLFGDEMNRSYFNHLRTDLIDTLTSLGVAEILRTNRGQLGIYRELVSCDYFDFLDGKTDRKSDEYMAQYSFVMV